MKKIILKFLLRNSGKKRAQRVFEALHEISLKGMNFGNGGSFKENGENSALSYIKEKIKFEKDITIFDVGGNIGEYAKLLANFFGKDSKIYSFEPSKKTFEKFTSNTNDIKNIYPNNIGISDKEENLTLYTNNDESGLASLYKRNLDHYGIKMNQSEEIKLSTIDSFCLTNNIDKIHFLKLDIEGNEYKALKGAERMIKNNKIDFIQFEFGGTNIDSKTFFQNYFYLLKDDYHIYRILKDGLYEIKKYSEIREVYLLVNYLAERKNLNATHQ